MKLLHVSQSWRDTGKNVYFVEDEDSAHIFIPGMHGGIQIAIKTWALERCTEMDLHPNSSRVLALTLLRTGSESNSRKPSLLNWKPQYFKWYCELSTNDQQWLCAWCQNTPEQQISLNCGMNINSTFDPTLLSTTVLRQILTYTGCTHSMEYGHAFYQM